MRMPVLRVPPRPAPAPDSKPAFFVTGGTLPRDAACYIERRADTALYDALAQGQFCYVLTPRQMGKSSLMVRTSTRLQREQGATTASLDLTAIGRNVTVAQWYHGLLGRLGRQLNVEDDLEDVWDASEGLGPLQRWTHTVGDVLLAHFDGPIVLFIDEIDAIRNLPFPADEFFAGIRECHNRRATDPRFARLTFCLLGVATPAELIADPAMSPFNVGRRIELTDFTEAEAAPLARGVDIGGPPVLTRILYWTGGHPYLTQRLGAAAEEERARTPAAIDALCDRLFLGRGARDRDDNLLFVQDRLLKADNDVAGLLDLYGKVRAGRRIREEEAGASAEALRLSGIARIDDKGVLRVRNRIYHAAFDRAWVRASLPDAELQRQRAAYRRGALRTLAGSTAALGLVGYLAVRATLAEREAQHERDIARHLLSTATVATLELAQRELNEGNIGRVRELLASCPPETQMRFEWRYLAAQCHTEEATLDENAVALQITPRGLLAVGTSDRSVRLWNIAAGQSRTLVAGTMSSPAYPVAAFSGDGTFAAVDRGSLAIVLVDLRTGQRLRTFPIPAGSAAAAFSRDGRMLAVGDFAGVVHLWDTETGRERSWRVGKVGAAVYSVDFSPNSRFLACAGLDRSISVWDAGTGKVFRRIPALPGVVWMTTFGPDGRLLATTSKDGVVRILDSVTGRVIQALEGHIGPVKTVAFSPNGALLASGGVDQTVRLWDVKSGRALRILKGHTATLKTLAFSDDGHWLATGAEDSSVKLWRIGQHWLSPLSPDLTTRGPFRDGVRETVLSPNASLAAGIDGARTKISVWDPATGRMFSTTRADGKTKFSAIGLSTDGGVLAAASDDGFLYPWITQTGKPLRPLRAGTGQLVSLVFAPDRNTVAVRDEKGIVRVLDVPSGVSHGEFQASEGIMAVALSRGARHVAAANLDGTVGVYDVATRRRTATLDATAETGTGGRFNVTLAFSPDGSALAAGGPGSTVRLWHLNGGGEPVSAAQILSGHAGKVYSVVFSPDGTSLATGGTDGIVRLWDVATSGETLSLSYGPYGVVSDLRFAEDGATLSSLDSEGHLRRWQTDAK